MPLPAVRPATLDSTGSDHELKVAPRLAVAESPCIGTEPSQVPPIRHAPQVFTRAARWPVQTLEALAAPELAELAGQLDESDPAAWSEYVVRFDHERQEQLRTLWRLTAQDPSFMRALVVSNPDLAQRALAAEGILKQNKRARHLQTTLYRYLARAAGRVEPCELWAGVTLANFGESTRVEAAPAPVRFAPDLRVFQSLLRALAAREDYRKVGLWKVNVTLERDVEGYFTFWARNAQGQVSRKRMRPPAAVAQVLKTIRGVPAASFGDLCERAGADSGLDVDTVEAVLLACIDGGILVGGLDLPLRYSSSWEALAQAACALHGPERAAWWVAYRKLRRFCRKLERELDALAPSELLLRFDRAAQVIRELAADLNLGCPELPRVVLRCDAGLPFRVTLGVEAQRAIATAIAEYEQFQRKYGLGYTLRSALVDEYVDGALLRRPLSAVEPLVPEPSPTEPLLTWESHERLMRAPEAYRQRLQSWSELLQGQPVTLDGNRATETAVSPLASLIFGLNGSRVVIQGATDEVAAIYSRYVPLWNPITRAPRDPFYGWFTLQLAEISHRTGLVLCELLNPCEANPNALVRPRYTEQCVSVWGAVAGELGLFRAETFVDSRSRTLLLGTAPQTQPAAVLSFASANLGYRDPVCQALLFTGFRAGRLAHLRAESMSFSIELESGRPSPEIKTPQGHVIRDRRTVVSGADLTQLIEASPELRFVRWQKLARRHGWAAMLHVARDFETPLLVPRDCPIALQALFEGASHVSALVVEERADQAFLEDDHGRRYITQFV
ncbi:MAG TPA: lantibiotic dehydratase, partial [Polyangiaceae bacterium]|nr:lantibiotic dehydratase [Polyangiaceae bacterium]